MIVIRGTDTPVTLGSPPSELGRIDNEVQHQRTIKRFAIGQTEVTVAQYQDCVEAGGCRPPEWLEPGGEHNIRTGRGLYYKNLGSAVTDENAPIVGVSFNDSLAFSAWLSKKTGKSYRLPSEAEWEYAARAGTTTAFWWGDEIDLPDGSARANCRGCGSADRKVGPEHVTSYAPNPWGLYNVHGNVWEWVADFYCVDQSTGPADGSARSVDDCPQRDSPNLRVLRGGSAFYTPDKMRAASRLRNFPYFRNFSVGFRVARDF
jgi:formylglycine-generating enzyme required for sulfatase activity